MKKELTIFLALVCSSAFAQQADKTIQKGNDYYKQQQFAKAAEEYNKAISADPASLLAKFNLANALYKQDKKVEAAQLFAELANNALINGLRAKAFYNKGVILSQQKNLEESIEAYKNALRNDPDDKEARENLQKALLELKKKNPPKKKEQDKQKKQEQQQQQKQPQSRISPKEAEQRLQLLKQKEKQVQQRVQSERNKSGAGKKKDW